MADLFLQFRSFLDHWRFVIDFDALLHPFGFKAFYFSTGGDAGEFEADLIAVDASG